MRPPPRLARDEAELASLVTAPEGVVKALDEAGDPARLASILRSDRGIDAAIRLEIYSNAFFARLRSALAKEFADLASALGDDAFHDLVKTYLMIHPPHRPSIRDAGAELPAFLARDGVAEPFRRHLPCAPALAAFEWAQTEVFDAADAPRLLAEDLARVEADAFADLVLEPIPALRIVELDFPVHELPDAPSHPIALALERRPAIVCVFRRDERVRFRELDALEARVQTAIADGVRFEAICEIVGDAIGEAAAASTLAGLLDRFVTEGLLRGRS